jgi:hypothetical protein
VPLNVDMATFSLPEWLQGKLSVKKIPHTPEMVDPIVAGSLKFLKEKYNPKVKYSPSFGDNGTNEGSRRSPPWDTASAPSM